MKSVALSLALVVATSVFAAQTPYIETFEVRLQNLDVVVTDAKGRPVHGLTKDDFVVVESGKPQEITNFAIYDAAAGSASANANPTAAPDEGAVSAPPPRRIVFFIDELSVQKMARARLYRNVKAFVDMMRPGDVAAVVRPTKSEKIVQEFTGDRAAIEAAIKQAIDESGIQLAGQKLEVAQLRWQLEWRDLRDDQRRPPAHIHNAKREYADAAARRVTHRLGQIRALTSSLGGVEGKKIVVLVTMGLGARPGSEVFDFAETLERLSSDSTPGDDVQDIEPIHHPFVHDLRPEIQEIARTAAANGVTIYALEPDVPLELNAKGMASAAPKKDPRTGDPGRDERKDLANGFYIDTLQNAEVTLAALTETTGGKWFRGLEQIDDTFKQVESDVSYYYSLAYRATGEAATAKGVKVAIRNRPELHVRTRTQVLEKSTDREMTDLVVASLLYPREVNELGIVVTPGKPEQARGWYTIPVDVVIPLKNLTFLPAEDGKYAAEFDLHYAAAGEKRDFGTGGTRQQRIEINADQYAQLAQTTYRYKTAIQVSPGRARIAIGVLDNATKLTGFRTVEVLAQ